MKKEKLQWKKVVWSIVPFVIGIALGILMLAYMENTLPEGISSVERCSAYVLMMVLLYVALFAVIIIHEAGHLVFGLLTGYRFCSFRIGSLMLVHDGEKLRFKRYALAGTGGQCLMAPPDAEDGNFPVVLYNMGGVIFNAVTSALCLVLYLLVEGGVFFPFFLLLLMVLGFYVALTNGIPMRTNMIENDGANTRALRKSASARYALWAQLKINEQITRGVRLKDMPAAWFTLPAEGAKNSLEASVPAFAASRLMDEHRFAEADTKMAELLADENAALAGLHRHLLICDRMYIELMGENRPEVLETLYDKKQKQFCKTMKTSLTVLRTMYVYTLLAKRDTEKAARIKAQFEKRGATYPYHADFLAERELIEMAEQISADKR